MRGLRHWMRNVHAFEDVSRIINEHVVLRSLKQGDLQIIFGERNWGRECFPSSLDVVQPILLTHRLSAEDSAWWCGLPRRATYDFGTPESDAKVTRGSRPQGN